MHAKRTAGIAALLSLGVAQLLPLTAHAEYRDGACKPGEGVTVIVDWNKFDGAGSGERELIRCILLEEGATEFPVLDDSDLQTRSVLRSAGISFEAESIITNINGIQDPPGWNWFFWGGVDGQWKGDGFWEPQPKVDSFVGIALGPRGETNIPVRHPEFDKKPDPTGKPTPGPTGDPTPGPKPDPDPEPTGDPDPAPTGEPTAAPPTGNPTPTGKPTSRSGATGPKRPRPVPPSNAPTSGSRPTSNPSAPEATSNPSATATPTPDATPTASENPSDDASGSAADAPSATPSTVWGREAAERHNADTEASKPGAPNTPWLAGILGIVALGGLGTAAAFGLRATQAPPLEDE